MTAIEKVSANDVLWYLSDDGERSAALGLAKDPTEFVVFCRPGGSAMKFYTHDRQEALSYVSDGTQPQWLKANPQAWILI